MQTTAADCAALRRRRGELEDRLGELRAERGVSGELGDAGSALGRLAGALRSLAAETGGAAAAADRLLAAARLTAAALSDLLGGARSGLVDAPEAVARVQAAVDAVSAAVERVERAFAVAEGSTSERLAATRAFVVDLSAALEGLDAVPGLRAFLDDAARALELMAAWAERAATLRRRRDGGPPDLPGIGPSLWPVGEREEPLAEEEALELRLARVDHDLLACGDRPGGPACVGCGDDVVDRVVGDVLDHASSLARDKATALAGSTADLVACRTALRRRRELDQEILEARWELQDAVRRRHTRKAADIRARLDRLLLDRRRMQRLMPAHVARYREAAAAYRQAARDWRDAVGERLVHAAEEEAWGTRELEHLAACHPALPPPPAPAPPVVRRARRKAVGLLAAAAVVLVAVTAALTMGGSSEEDEPVAVVETTTTSAVPSTTASTARANRAPEVGAISATFEFPVTTYTVEATDADGDELTYTWVKEGDRDCGDFTTEGPVARWSHPHPPCPEEPFHPSTVTVTVVDGEGNRVTAVYERGSEPGTGEPPA